MIARLRSWRELRRQMREANPRGLSQSAYKAELAAQKAATRAMDLAKALPPVNPDLAYARQLAPHLIPAPNVTRDEQMRIMRDQLVRDVNSGRW